MDKLTELDYWLNDLDNYGNKTNDEFKTVVNHVNKILGNEFFDTDGVPVLKVPENTILDQIEKAKKYIRKLLREVHKSEFYNVLMRAYRNDEQMVLRQLIPKIFCNVTICNSKFSKKLYHGISVNEDTDIGDYINLAMEISTVGLSPSPHGRHHSMDENIRPIYNVIDPEETHGILFFGLEPAIYGYNVFNPHFEAERLVYSPSLKIPMTLFLKSKRYLEQNLRMEGYSPKDEKKFRDIVEKELRKRRINFTLSEPTGFQRKDGISFDCC